MTGGALSQVCVLDQSITEQLFQVPSNPGHFMQDLYQCRHCLSKDGMLKPVRNVLLMYWNAYEIVQGRNSAEKRFLNTSNEMMANRSKNTLCFSSSTLL